MLKSSLNKQGKKRKMVISQEQKAELVKQFGEDTKNTGKTEVQVAILNTDIKLLTGHLQQNPKDHHGKRGLFAKVSKRKQLLKYLQKIDVERYRKLIDTLGLRK
jgi:small subunit ribosomal protein S15